MEPDGNEAYEAERALRCQQGAVAACRARNPPPGGVRAVRPDPRPRAGRPHAARPTRVDGDPDRLRLRAARTLRAAYTLGSGLVLALVLALMVNVLVALAGGVRSPYYAGNSLVLMGISIMLPWPPSWVLASSVLVVGIYAVTVWLTPIDDPSCSRPRSRSSGARW